MRLERARSRRTRGYRYDRRGNLEIKTSSVSSDADVIWYNYAGPRQLTGAQIDADWNGLDYDANGNFIRYRARSVPFAGGFRERHQPKLRW